MGGIRERERGDVKNAKEKGKGKGKKEGKQEGERNGVLTPATKAFRQQVLGKLDLVLSKLDRLISDNENIVFTIIKQSENIVNAINGIGSGNKKVFAFGVSIPRPKEKSMPLSVTITNEEAIDITANPVTSTGKPAKIDGALSVSVVSGDSTFTQDPATPNMVTLVSSDNPGDTQFAVSADADLGAGVETISDVVTLTVAGAKAVQLGLVAGTPRAKV